VPAYFKIIFTYYFRRI